MDSDDLNITKIILSRQLMEDHFINDKVANSIVLLLIGLLRDKSYLNKIYEKTINKSLEIDIQKKIEVNIISGKKLELKEINKLIKIKRIESVIGSALLVDIKIDEGPLYKFSNGEEKILPIENGQHTLFASFDMNYDKIKFEINNNYKEYNIVIKPPVKIIEVI